MVRDQINYYLEHTNHALAYLQTEVKKGENESRKSMAPSTDGPGDGTTENSPIKTKKDNEEEIKEKQQELFTKNQSIIDNFAKFEDDLYKFDAELTSMMINPIAEPGIFATAAAGSSSSSGGGKSAKKEDLDIDKLLENLKKQGEEMLS